VSDLEAWNPRFVLFAREQGVGPKEWLDSRRDGDGVVSMHPFTAWISERWAEYRACSKRLPPADRTDFDTTSQQRFDAWLSKRCAS